MTLFLILEWPAGAAGRRLTRSDSQAEICSDPRGSTLRNRPKSKIRIRDRILMLQVLRWWETVKPTGKSCGNILGMWDPVLFCLYPSEKEKEELTCSKSQWPTLSEIRPSAGTNSVPRALWRSYCQFWSIETAVLDHWETGTGIAPETEIGVTEIQRCGWGK